MRQKHAYVAKEDYTIILMLLVIIVQIDLLRVYLARNLKQLIFMNHYGV